MPWFRSERGPPVAIHGWKVRATGRLQDFKLQLRQHPPILLSGQTTRPPHQGIKRPCLAILRTTTARSLNLQRKKKRCMTMRYTEKQQEGRTQKDVMDDDVAAAFYARPVPMSNYYLIPQSSIEISASSESLGEKTTPEVKEVEARSEEQNRVNRKQEFGNPRHGGDFGRQYRPITQRARPTACRLIFFVPPSTICRNPSLRPKF